MSVLEYWLSFLIAGVRDLWSGSRGRHRRGWFEKSTFETASENWGRMARVIEQDPAPSLVPVVAMVAEPLTIGQRARARGASTDVFVRVQFDEIVAGAGVWQIGAGEHRERAA